MSIFFQLKRSRSTSVAAFNDDLIWDFKEEMTQTLSLPLHFHRSITHTSYSKIQLHHIADRVSTQCPAQNVYFLPALTPTRSLTRAERSSDRDRPFRRAGNLERNLSMFHPRPRAREMDNAVCRIIMMIGEALGALLLLTMTPCDAKPSEKEIRTTTRGNIPGFMRQPPPALTPNSTCEDVLRWVPPDVSSPLVLQVTIQLERSPTPWVHLLQPSTTLDVHSYNNTDISTRNHHLTVSFVQALWGSVRMYEKIIFSPSYRR